MKTIIALVFAPIFFCYGQKKNNDSEIYELLTFIIHDQKLDKTHGLNLIPEEKFQLDMTDEEFLNELTISNTITETSKEWDSTKSKNDSFREIVSVSFPLLPKCLTASDVISMLDQKVKNENFKWNNSKLGFNLNNHSNWYEFSVPLISRDREKAVMMVRDLCKGLCGADYTFLLKKENGKWTSQKLNQWIH